MPEQAEAVIVADREFHSIDLAEWIEKELNLKYVLPMQAGTTLEIDGQMMKAGELARTDESLQFEKGEG